MRTCEGCSAWCLMFLPRDVVGTVPGVGIDFQGRLHSNWSFSPKNSFISTIWPWTYKMSKLLLKNFQKLKGHIMLYQSVEIHSFINSSWRLILSDSLKDLANLLVMSLLVNYVDDDDFKFVDEHTHHMQTPPEWGLQSVEWVDVNQADIAPLMVCTKFLFKLLPDSLKVLFYCYNAGELSLCINDLQYPKIILIGDHFLCCPGCVNHETFSLHYLDCHVLWTLWVSCQ